MMQIVYSNKFLIGTNYFELLPGKFEGKHWNDNSVYIHEMDFTLLEPAFHKAFDEFYHFGCHVIHRFDWKLIIDQLIQLKELINMDPIEHQKVYIIDYFKNSADNLITRYQKHKQEIILLIDELIIWINDTSKQNEYISIIGI